MDKVPRLAFLKHMAHQALEYLPVILNVPIGPSVQETEPETKWVSIGYLEDWPPGKIQTVNQGRQIVISCDQGLLALDTPVYTAQRTHPRRPLRLEVNGQIALHPQGTWPENTLLSALTGNQIHYQEEIIIP